MGKYLLTYIPKVAVAERVGANNWGMETQAKGVGSQLSLNLTLADRPGLLPVSPIVS